MNCSPPGSLVHEILQARVLERVVMPSCRGSSWPRDWTFISYVSCIGRQVLYHQRPLSIVYMAPQIGRCPTIASLSFGATRMFEMRKKPPPVSSPFIYFLFLPLSNDLWEKSRAPKRLLFSDLGDCSMCLVDEMFSTDGLYPVDNFWLPKKPFIHFCNRNCLPCARCQRLISIGGKDRHSHRPHGNGGRQTLFITQVIGRQSSSE